MDMSSLGHKAVFLNGIPGTGTYSSCFISQVRAVPGNPPLTHLSGKTILASSIVQHLQNLQSANGHSRPVSVLYFFFKHLQPEKRTLAGMLLSFISQMVFQDEVAFDLVYQRTLTVDQQKIRSVSVLRELAGLVLKAQSRCFIVVDALDECVGEQLTNVDVAQGEVIDWLESLVLDEDIGVDGTGQEDRRVRLLICGQRNGFLEDRLRPYPAIPLDSCPAHIRYIETYSETKCIRIQQKFKTSEDIRIDMIRKVNSRAKGKLSHPLHTTPQKADSSRNVSLRQDSAQQSVESADTGPLQA